MKRLLKKIREKLVLNSIDRLLDEKEKRYQYILHNHINELHNHINELHNHINDACMSTNVMVGDNVRKLITAFYFNNKAFSQFKRCHEGKPLVIVGAGPSVNKFNKEKMQKDCIYIGLNRAFKKESINFSYLFTIDKLGIQDYYKEFFHYRDSECIKFIGDQDYAEISVDENAPLRKNDYQIPESVIKGNNIYQYITTCGGFFNDKFTYHIESEPLGNFSTVSLQAMQFALYTNPSKIYLVGIDCSTDGHFIGKTAGERVKNEIIENSNRAISDWKLCKSFSKTYYPDTEIISVNPVNLKGVFKDWYQEEGDEPK